MAALSPMMQQYFEIKISIRIRSFSSGLAIFMRCFMTMRFLRQKELELTLTGRDCGQAERCADVRRSVPFL